MTVLLLGITLTVITSGSSTAIRVYNRITMKSNAMSLISTVTTAMNADLRSAGDVRQEDGAWWFYSGQRKLQMTFVTGDDGMIKVRCKVPSDGPGSAQKRDLVVGSEGLYDGGKLGARLKEGGFLFTKDQAGGYFTYTLEVYQAGSGQVLEEQEISVRIA